VFYAALERAGLADKRATRDQHGNPQDPIRVLARVPGAGTDGEIRGVVREVWRQGWAGIVAAVGGEGLRAGLGVAGEGRLGSGPVVAAVEDETAEEDGVDGVGEG
jgi:hypothetical protein